MSITHLLCVSAFILLGGLLNIIRGGGFGGNGSIGVLNISGWLKSKNLIAPRNLVIASIMMILPLYFILTHLGFDTISTLVLSFVTPVGFMLSYMSGWGPYFDIGTNPLDIHDHRENMIIDTILFKLYGAAWIPTYLKGEIAEEFDLVLSPTGDVRPYEWRRKRDMTGMVLRMSFTAILFSAIFISKYFLLDVSVTETVLSILGFTVLGSLIGLIYGNIVTYKVFEKLGHSVWRFRQPIGLSEIVSGMYIFALIIFALML